MKKCAFINPYFGKLPKTFPVFLKTCEKNQEFEWLFFTDDETDYDYPANVKRILMSFSEMRELAQSKFDFPIVLDQPYKLCDYKPAYGLIFEEYLKDYKFWGHCDVDTIMGNLGKFISDEMLEIYDKIFCLGHMILYRNTYENSRVFMSAVNGRFLYKEAFTTPNISWFDEPWNNDTNVNTVFRENGKSVMMEDWSVNFNILPTKFTRVVYKAEKNDYDVLPYERTLYVWDNGDIRRYYVENGELKYEEELYMHFQWRDMIFDNDVLNADLFKVIPNRFCALSNEIRDNKDFYRESRMTISPHYFQILQRRIRIKIKKIRKRKNKTL